MKPLISFAKKRFGRKHHLKKFFMGYSFMIVFLFLFAIFLLWKFNAAYTSLITEDKKELLVNKAQESAFYIKNFYLTRVTVCRTWQILSRILFQPQILPL